MTKEQCREAGATMIAWADGKSIQYRRRDQSEWFDIEPACTATILSWDWDEFEYRIKPMPKLRPWTADEVPARACRIIERELNAANEKINRLNKDSERLQWLLNRGLAWRDCYDDHWIEGEWLYAEQDAIETIDKAMEEKP